MRKQERSFGRFLLTFWLALFAGFGWSLPASAAAPHTQVEAVRPQAASLASEIRRAASGKIGRFYKERGYQPLWAEDGRIGPNAKTLLAYLDSAWLDGLESSRYKPSRLRAAIARAQAGGPADVARAEIALSKTFAKYVRDARKPGQVSMEYVDASLKPGKLSEETILRAAALPASFADYMQSMGWMSAHYVRIRGLLDGARKQGHTDAVLQLIRVNLDRARLLPPPSVRHIVVDVASANLWYYQAGKQQGTMRVVVGANETRTPLMAGSINYAILNPYWNVPTYLARNNIARKILAGRTLKSMHMEVLSDWTSSAEKLDSSAVDWKAVADGRQTVRLRELPGPANSMGKMKFVFPNPHGIYLHDTPNTDLFKKADRHLSNGCIRLEKAAALGKWLGGKSVFTKSKTPEQAVPLSVPVPVYLTYLTATPTKQGVGFLKDVYTLDK